MQREYQVPSSAMLFTLLARLCLKKASTKHQRSFSAHGGACDRLCSSSPWWPLGQGFRGLWVHVEPSVYQVQGSTYTLQKIARASQ